MFKINLVHLFYNPFAFSYNKAHIKATDAIIQIPAFYIYGIFHLFTTLNVILSMRKRERRRSEKSEKKKHKIFSKISDYFSFAKMWLNLFFSGIEKNKKKCKKKTVTHRSFRLLFLKAICGREEDIT